MWLVLLRLGVSLLMLGGCTERRSQSRGPEIESVNPAAALPDEATPITVRGRFFRPLVTVSFTGQSSVQTNFVLVLGNAQLEDVVYVGEEVLTAIIPAGLPEGLWDLEMTDPAGRVATLAQAVHISSDPCVLGCDDSDPCNGVETCGASGCEPGTALVCDDSDPCNGVETCGASGCVPGTALVCDDSDPCNGVETCGATGCEPGGALVCDDSDPCTSNNCVAGVGCDFPDIPGCQTCAELSGGECAATETCLLPMLPAGDSAVCCPAGECFERSERLLMEALATATPVVVDGDRSDWAGIPRWPVTKVAIGPSPAVDEFSATVALQWDATAVYVLVEVTDDVLRPLEGGANYDDDSIEVYFDLDASNPTPAYDADEAWCFVKQDNSINLGAWNEAAVFSSDANDDWWFEISVEWPSAVIVPESGHVIGFDVAINDDDGPAGAGREGQLWWNDETGQLWTDATLFGLVRLKADGSPSLLPVCGDTNCEGGENATNCPVDC